MNSSSENTSPENILRAQWPAPVNVKTLITQKNSFITQDISSQQKAPINKSTEFGFNVATHVGDSLEEVLVRRNYLKNTYLPSEPFWLNQIHGVQALCLDHLDKTPQKIFDADASFTFSKDNVCVVSTADCLPIFLSDTQGQFVAAIHAGWQGLYKGVIEQCYQDIVSRAEFLNIKLNQEELLAYIGPSICKNHYQVDDFFYQRFYKKDSRFGDEFQKDELEAGKYLANLKGIAKIILADLGIKNISDSGLCSFNDNRFYSHRKNAHTGRFASLIWLEK